MYTNTLIYSIEMEILMEFEILAIMLTACLKY